MPSDLPAVLSRIGKAVEQQLHPDGSRLLLLSYGARVLGLYAPGSDKNFFWTHPALQTEASAASFYQSDGWHNSGGDRTWLAPEVDVCFPDFPERSKYRVPSEVDPGNFAVVGAGQPARFLSRFTVTLSRSRQQVSGVLSKSWGPALNPLRHEPVWEALGSIQYAGYTQRTSLELEGEVGPAQIGLWNVLALPPGGEVLLPTFVEAEPRIYSGPIAPADLVVTGHLVRFQARGDGIQKIGIRAVASSGRIGYLYPEGNDWALVVRNFVVDPSGVYVDVPWERITSSLDLAYSTQACRVNNALGAFCEIEYHAPAIGFGTGRTRSDDTSQVWAFRGPAEDIQKVANNLLFSSSG